MIRKNDWSADNNESEINELRNSVERQINDSWEERNILRNGESRVIASFMTHADTRWGQHPKVYSKSAADVVVNELKKAGYYVWFSSVCYDEESYWVTARPECPHSWYHRI